MRQSILGASAFMTFSATPVVFSSSTGASVTSSVVPGVRTSYTAFANPAGMRTRLACDGSRGCLSSPAWPGTPTAIQRCAAFAGCDGARPLARALLHDEGVGTERQVRLSHRNFRPADLDTIAIDEHALVSTADDDGERAGRRPLRLPAVRFGRTQPGHFDRPPGLGIDRRERGRMHDVGRELLLVCNHHRHAHRRDLRRAGARIRRAGARSRGRTDTQADHRHAVPRRPRSGAPQKASPHCCRSSSGGARLSAGP